MSARDVRSSPRSAGSFYEKAKDVKWEDVADRSKTRLDEASPPKTRLDEAAEAKKRDSHRTDIPAVEDRSRQNPEESRHDDQNGHVRERPVAILKHQHRPVVAQDTQEGEALGGLPEPSQKAHQEGSHDHGETQSHRTTAPFAQGGEKIDHRADREVEAETVRKDRRELACGRQGLCPGQSAADIVADQSHAEKHNAGQQENQRFAEVHLPARYGQRQKDVDGASIDLPDRQAGAESELMSPDDGKGNGMNQGMA